MPDDRAAIIVHGGAGRLASQDVEPRIAGCREAARIGWRVLGEGGTALDAAEAAVTALEDDPLFNAGTGAALNAAGQVELDASIMDGARLAAGAVAAVTGIPNPVRLARAVLEDGRHVLLAGEGARRFAQEKGIPECAPEALIVARQRERWERKHGTVGCVALDAQGRLAAATSTGGMPDKLPGRVGDSAIIGAGTYADERGAVSCTGIGEAIIRMVLARSALDLLDQGLAPDRAAQRAVALLAERTGSEAGLIIIDRHGRAGCWHNAQHMPVCAITADGAEHTSA
jgi:beta-aspartyl-peptidase (threonine type)